MLIPYQEHWYYYVLAQSVLALMFYYFQRLSLSPSQCPSFSTWRCSSGALCLCDDDYDDSTGGVNLELMMDEEETVFEQHSPVRDTRGCVIKHGRGGGGHHAG